VSTRSPSDRENGNVLPLGGVTKSRVGIRRGIGARSAFLGLAIAAASVLGTTAVAEAGTVTITTNSSQYSSSGAGEWGVTAITGLGVVSMGSPGAFSGNLFQTFCLERNESLSSGTFNYSLDTGARAGGVGGATGGFDALSSQSAWLFTTWYNGNLTNANGFSYNYNYGSGRVASAGQLQTALWLLEGELTESQVDHSTAGYAWYLLANSSSEAANFGLGNVRVLVLTDTTTGANRQDVLVMVPLPSAALLGLGLMTAVGAFGLIRRRRNHSVL
jgi:hypothetical protein